MSMVLDRVRVDNEMKPIQQRVEALAGLRPLIRWRYSAYSNERFPLRAYVSALYGTGLEVEEVLVLAVTWRIPSKAADDRLVVGARILDGDGIVLAEGPAIEVIVPEGQETRASTGRIDQDGAGQLHAAMLSVNFWLEGQSSLIRQTLDQTLPFN